MNTVRTSALGSVLTMVATSANAVTSTFSALGTGAEMLNAYAQSAAADQADSAKIHRKVYRSNLVTQAALEQSKLELEVQTHLASNPSVAEGFKSCHAELTALFDEAK